METLASPHTEPFALCLHTSLTIIIMTTTTASLSICFPSLFQMRSSKLGAGSRNGTISHTGISETDSPAARDDPKRLKNKTTIKKKKPSNLQPFRIGTNSSAYLQRAVGLLSVIAQ